MWMLELYSLLMYFTFMAVSLAVVVSASPSGGVIVMALCLMLFTSSRMLSISSTIPFNCLPVIAAIAVEAEGEEEEDPAEEEAPGAHRTVWHWNASSMYPSMADEPCLDRN